MGRESEQEGENARSGEQGRDQGAKQGSKPSAVEWVVGAASALMVVAMIGFVLYQGVAGSKSLPDVTVERGDVEETSDGFRVGFRAFNSGGRTAAGVMIEGRLLREGREIEASEVQLDYVPARSERRGALFFTADPRRHRLELRAKGYREP